MGGFQDASTQGGGGGTISLVRGMVAALDATLEPNILRIRSVTWQMVGSSPPSDSDLHPLPPPQPQRSPRGATPHPQDEPCRPPFLLPSPHCRLCPNSPISPPTPQLTFAPPLAAVSPPKLFRPQLSPRKHPTTTQLGLPPLNLPPDALHVPPCFLDLPNHHSPICTRPLTPRRRMQGPLLTKALKVSTLA